MICGKVPLNNLIADLKICFRTYFLPDSVIGLALSEVILDCPSGILYCSKQENSHLI